MKSKTVDVDLTSLKPDDRMYWVCDNNIYVRLNPIGKPDYRIINNINYMHAS